MAMTSSYVGRNLSCALPLVAVVFAAVTISAQRGAGPGDAAGPHPAIGNPQAIADGEKLYNETCTACHGKDGTGGELGPPVAAQNRRYLRRTDQDIFDTIKNGNVGTQMPPYAGQFTDDQIWRITAYIRGLRGTAIDTPSAGDVASGEAIFWGKGACGSCHMMPAVEAPSVTRDLPIYGSRPGYFARNPDAHARGAHSFERCAVHAD